MSKDENPDFLICGTAHKSDDIKLHVPGTTIRFCGKCSTDIFMAPSGQKLVAEGNVIPICENCGLELVREVRDSGEEPDFRAPDGAEEEISAAFLRNVYSMTRERL